MCALTLSAACLLFRDQIISPAGFSGKISQIAVDFLAIFALALAPNYIMILSTAIFRAGGEACLVLMAMAMIGLINIAMNFLLVFGLFSLTGFGYRGIALSTAGAMAAGTTMTLNQVARLRAAIRA